MIRFVMNKKRRLEYKAVYEQWNSIISLFAIIWNDIESREIFWNIVYYSWQ